MIYLFGAFFFAGVLCAWFFLRANPVYLYPLTLKSEAIAKIRKTLTGIARRI